MIGYGIEYSPCFKCDKTKCSFCVINRLRKTQSSLDAKNSKGIYVEGTYDDEDNKYIVISSLEEQELSFIDIPGIKKMLEGKGNVVLSVEQIVKITDPSRREYQLKITYRDKTVDSPTEKGGVE